MESSTLPDCGSPESSSDFGFAFNEVKFSDRILRIEIIPDVPGAKLNPDVSLDNWARNRKRRRDDQLSNAYEPNEQHEKQILCLCCEAPDFGGIVAYKNQEEEAVAITREPPISAEITRSQPGHEVSGDNETSSSNMDLSAVQFRTLHISSPILAAKSLFFYKLFSNGMKESEEQLVVLQIQASEEAAFLDLLNFIYTNKLPRNTPTALLDVLMIADKFGVPSCMRYCSRVLRSLPMTCESALLYLDLPSNVLMGDSVQQLTDAAKQFLVACFMDFSKFQEDGLNLPLAGIEAVLSSDFLQAPSEDNVYNFVLKWAQLHYPKLDERREILTTRLFRFVRFSCMSCGMLKRALTCNDINCEVASKLVLDALFFKAEAPYRQRSLVAEEANAPFRRFTERAYKFRPLKVVEFESPRQQCVVYLDLKREECKQLFPFGLVLSQVFHLGGHRFFLSGRCNKNLDQGSDHCFGLFLFMQEKDSASLTVEYEFAVRVKLSEEFVTKYRGKHAFTGGKSVGDRNLFSKVWAEFVADDSPYFINDVLHLRAQLTIKTR